jgi:iron(III) transport system permease protein
LVVAPISLGPVGYLCWRALEIDAAALLARMWDLGLPRLVATVFALAASTTALCILIALPLAWLVERSDLPGRSLIRWLAPLPLPATISRLWRASPPAPGRSWLIGFVPARVSAR